ncbi:MAG: hypothetical protein KFF73_00350 [Cyclobacteriaceae bacterium]|nr:hypothetical protein [Cyclobacteriaceae bacterium]
MKKLVFTAVIFLFASITYGQAFKEGNLIAVHVITIELKPGVWMADFQKFHVNTLIPAYEKNYPGWQLYLAKGLRGINQNKYGWIIVVESEEVRDKYYNDDGSVTEFGQAAAEKMKPILEEAEKFGKLHRTYTDWIIL